jgi:hypothetical protein
MLFSFPDASNFPNLQRIFLFPPDLHSGDNTSTYTSFSLCTSEQHPYSHLLEESLLHANFLIRLLPDPEDVGDIFLRKVVCLLPDYTELYPRRENSYVILVHLPNEIFSDPKN